MKNLLVPVVGKNEEIPLHLFYVNYHILSDYSY